MSSSLETAIILCIVCVSIFNYDMHCLCLNSQQSTCFETFLIPQIDLDFIRKGNPLPSREYDVTKYFESNRLSNRMLHADTPIQDNFCTHQDKNVRAALCPNPPWIWCYLAYNFTNSIYRNISILDDDKSRIWLIVRSILRESWAQFCEKQKNTFEQEKSDVRREICRQKGFQSFCRFQESSIFCIHKWIEESPTSSQEMEKCLPFIFVLNQDIWEIKKKNSISFTYRRKTSFTFLLRRD